MSSELYLFNDSGTYYGFTPTVFSKTLSGITYIPAIVSVSTINLTDNFAKSPVTFKFDALNSFAKRLLKDVPEQPIQVTIYRDNVAYWVGTVKSAVRKTLPYIEISCDSSFTSTVKGGIHYRMLQHCNHTIYSAQCGVVDSDFVVSGTTTASSNVLTISGLTQPTGYFNNGKAFMNNQVRRILDSNGTTIRLASPFVGIQTGTILLYPGCLGTKEACISFNNLDNGLFFDRQSSKNPYGPTGLL